MQNRIKFRTSLALSCIVALGLGSGSAFAQHGGGGGGGGHGGGGGGHFGGAAGGHAYGGRGGYGGGYHGGYGGYRGGYGYGRGYGYGGWGYGGWGYGLGLGLFFGALPIYYSTYWWDGIPYYYADNTYYRYDNGARQYETVAPPDGLAAQNQQNDTTSTNLIAYPKNGQTEEQQTKDKYECHHWAVTQSGFDPTQGAPVGATATAASAKRGDYMRAQAACLDGRGYSVQ